MEAETVTEWERFDKAMKAIMSVPPETAAAIRRGEVKAEGPAPSSEDRPGSRPRSDRETQRPYHKPL